MRSVEGDVQFEGLFPESGAPPFYTLAELIDS